MLNKETVGEKVSNGKCLEKMSNYFASIVKKPETKPVKLRNPVDINLKVRDGTLMEEEDEIKKNNEEKEKKPPPWAVDSKRPSYRKKNEVVIEKRKAYVFKPGRDDQYQYVDKARAAASSYGIIFSAKVEVQILAFNQILQVKMTSSESAIKPTNLKWNLCLKIQMVESL